MRFEAPLYRGVKAYVNPNPVGYASGAGKKYNYFLHIDLVMTSTKRTSLPTIKLAVETFDEANEWVNAINAASEDGGSAPEEVEEEKRAFNPSLRDFHVRHQISLISSDQKDKQSYRGVANLILIVTFVSNFRSIVENIETHGNLLTQILNINASLSHADRVVVACAAPLLFTFIILSFFIEKVATSPDISSSTTNILHVINCSLSLLVPGFISHYTEANPAVCAPFVCLSTVLFLKLTSYAHTNTVLRRRWLSGPPRESSVLPPPTSYPHNVTMYDIFRFFAFPTLCYQTSYPRTDVIRKKWLAKRCAELVLTLTVQVILFQQFMMPVLQESIENANNSNPITMSKYVLDLAVPSLGCWLCMFYALFHLWLNILAEITYFGDRLFYKAWWNASRLDVYWRNWNIPVHAWLVRHIFMPCLCANLSKEMSMFLVFAFSAFLHEWLVSVPCHTYKAWAFLGMLAQVPLVALTAAIDLKLKGNQWIGNFIFWFSFCMVGQPLCILLYFLELAR